MRQGILPPSVERSLNFIVMMGMIGILIGAFVYQFSYRQLPCTLCLLQRVAMIGIAIGAAMNVMLGPAARHYGVCLVSAVFGLVVAIRQSLLHINPFFDIKTGQPTLEATANPPFGEAVMGLHMYVWGVLIFLGSILAVGLLQLIGAQSDERADGPEWLSRLGSIGVGLLAIVAASETVGVFLECGLGHCPDDGSWDWWILR